MNKDSNGGADRTRRITVEGRNCWRAVRSNRVAFLVDAAAYFRAFKAAARRARRSILIIGWEVNSQTQLEYPDEADAGVPNELGPFLDHLACGREGPEIKVLNWDSPLFYGLNREWVPQARFDWFTHPRLCFALDAQHPLGASHHQKIVVIDDNVAFLGGLDLTIGRLDGTEHRPEDPRRRTPNGAAYAPFHDIQVAVDGPAAQALAAVARERWKLATDQRLKPVDSGEDCWPPDLAPDLADVEVAISRSHPAWKGRAEVREIETLFVDSVARARETVYIENQYFTAGRVAQAVLDRLEHADCPEIALVVPRESTDLLEQTAMGSRQRRLFARLRDADRHGRFRIYTPVVGERGEVAVKVHAKVMVIDGRFLQIGSANLNNRSMGLDTECNLALEGAPGSATAKSITQFRDRLLAEHLDAPPDRVASEIESRSSLIDAIEALRGSGRSLVPFPEVSPDRIDTLVADSELFDPAAPAEPERIAHDLAGEEIGQSTLRKSIGRLAAVIVALLGLAALWHWGPLSELADASRLEAWAQALRSGWTATAAVIAAYVVGGLLMFPVMVLIMATGLLYGPVAGLLVAGTGSLLSAVAGYGAGVLLGRKTLRRMSGGRLDRVSQQLARRGLLSMTIIRLIPLAPFTLINLAAGASHISFRDFVFGSVLGMAPGIVATVLLSSQLGEVVRAPDALNVGILLGLLLVVAAAGTWTWRHFARRDVRPQETQ